MTRTLLSFATFAFSMTALGQNPTAAPAAATERLAPVARFIGGQWVVDGVWSDGKPLHARNVFEWGVGHTTIHCRTFVGQGKEEYQRYEDTFAWNADRNCLYDVSFTFDGSSKQNRIDTPDTATLNIGFAPLHAGDPAPKVKQVLHFTGPDAFEWTVNVQKDSAWEQIIQATWKREPLSAHATDNSLFVASGPELRSLTKEATVNASPHDVFASWTTSQGIKSFLEADSNIDLRIGGPYEIYFAGPTAPLADRGSNGCQILSYLPDRMLTFSWNAPPKFPEERAQRAWVVIELEPIGANQTKVRLTHTGFGSAGKWDEVYAYFDRAWGNVLKALAEHYAKS